MDCDHGCEIMCRLAASLLGGEAISSFQSCSRWLYLSPMSFSKELSCASRTELHFVGREMETFFSVSLGGIARILLAVDAACRTMISCGLF